MRTDQRAVLQSADPQQLMQISNIMALFEDCDSRAVIAACQSEMKRRAGVVAVGHMIGCPAMDELGPCECQAVRVRVRVEP